MKHRVGYHRQGPPRVKNTGVVIASHKHTPDTEGSPCGDCTTRMMTDEERARYGPAAQASDDVKRVRAFYNRNKSMAWIGLNSKQIIDDEAAARVEHIRSKMHGE